MAPEELRGLRRVKRQSERERTKRGRIRAGVMAPEMLREMRGVKGLRGLRTMGRANER